MSKLRIGIIGTGGIAHSHMRAYLQMDDVEVVAGSDIIPGKAKAFFEEFEMPDAKAFEDTQEMLDTMNLDAVSVCTYNTQHRDCTVQALKAGCHVLLEKPMTLYVEEAIDIMRAEKDSGKIVSIGFQPRYDTRMEKVREIVQSGVLGDIYYIQTGGGRRHGIPGSTFIEKDKAGVGCLADIGCYSLDMVLSAIGYPKPLTVSAAAYGYLGKQAHFNRKPEDVERFSVDDFSAAFVRLEGGITLDFRMSWAMNMDTTGNTLILGTKGGLKIEPANAGTPFGGAWDGSCGRVFLYHPMYGEDTETEIPVDAGVKSNNFFCKVRAFVEAVQEGKPAPIPTSEIIYNQAIIDGIIRSNASGHEVEIVIPEI